jgi:predicted secreted protein
MGLELSIAVYLTIWWVVFLVVLPLGLVSHAEAGIDKRDGGDPGAPVDPKLKRKALTTTWVSAALFAVLWLATYFHLFTWPRLASLSPFG